MSGQSRSPDLNARPRRLLRAVATTATTAGAALLAWGVFGFAGGILSESGPETAPMGRYLLMLGVGGVVLMVGLVCFRVDLVRVTRGYPAAETAPAIHSASVVATEGVAIAEGTAVLCRQCGVGLAPGSRFCSSCGDPVG